MKVSTGTKLRRMEFSSKIADGRFLRDGMFTMIGDDGTVVVIPDPFVVHNEGTRQTHDLCVRVTVEIFDPPSEQKP
jgi:hypothetical protein